MACSLGNLGVRAPYPALPLLPIASYESSRRLGYGALASELALTNKPLTPPLSHAVKIRLLQTRQRGSKLPRGDILPVTA